MQAHLDYLWHNLKIINPGKDEFPLHYGLGLQIETRETGDDRFGVRFPLGFGYWRSGAAFDVFIEVVPMMMLSPETEFEFGAAVGARYFF